jgi:hypothetical protein
MNGVLPPEDVSNIMLFVLQLSLVLLEVLLMLSKINLNLESQA